MSRLTQLIGKHPALLTLLVVVSLVVLPEVTLRALRWPPAAHWHDELPPNPTYLWVLDPGIYRHGSQTTTINLAGMRGRLPGDVGEGQRRVLLVGDSSIFGWEVPDGSTLAESLEKELGNRVAVFNGGVPGYSTEQSRRWLDDLLPATRPQLVVIANQWSDSTISAFVDRQLIEEASTFGYRVRYHALRLANYARLWRAVRYATRGSGGDTAFRRAIDGLLSSHNVGQGKSRVPVDDYASNLAAMVEQSRQAGADVILLMLACPMDLASGNAGIGEGASILAFRHAMEKVANETGCPLIRAEDPLRSAGLPASALFVDNIHPSAAGHAAIAQGLARFLMDHGWEQGGTLCQTTDSSALK